MTQIQLATKCEFEKATMSRIESGRSNISILNLLKISNALEVNIRDLFIDGSPIVKSDNL